MSERQKVTALRVATFAEQQPEEFDRRNLTEEGLFLLSLPRPGFRWVGCRRFRCKLDGSIWIADTDNGAFEPYQAHVGFKVIGKVLTVYKENRCG